MEDHKVRGNMLLLIQRMAKEHLGDQVFKNVIDSVDERTRATLSQTLISQEWYDLSVHTNFLDAIQKISGRKELGEVTKRVAEKQMKGLYGVIAKFYNVKRMIPRAGEMWLKMFQPGVMEGKIISETEVECTLTGFKTCESLAYCTEVWIGRFMELLDKRKVEVSSHKFINSRTIHFSYLFVER